MFLLTPPTLSSSSSSSSTFLLLYPTLLFFLWMTTTTIPFAGAFIAKNKTPSSAPPLLISDEIGTSPTFRGDFFDPLNLANDANFPFMREAELKHGRIAMWATLGMAIPDIFPKKFETVHQLLLSPSHNLKFGDVPYGLGAITTVPWQGWIQITIFVGILETVVFVQRDKNAMPGDYGVGYFGLRDKAAHERSLLVELEHGRTAMVAFMGQVASELNTEMTVGDQWRSVFGDGINTGGI
mmetsp:Transcript_22655/g.33122  ORF Transcript_22655/g.33122 Transcript_22655/m.33122 type:complete len:239 (-) Transcript_22655:478-1194(-)|eukprot:CAMPEP_0195521576 /NCGR_PEP_ID=MMETSP0794_2-20130614/18965_1 /TAXON_ID=515487 /ORGANISM="Stephanopyxis turris, Strain CCMP 815" /LENGTH=238 /DNA_ID=CAMNT_0040651157 /DNA_START=103 /DNA_END=819 /DNA_ORIENTATION=+